MRAFEIMFILVPDEKEVLDKEIRSVEELIQNNGGKLEKTDQWGKKRLAYDIRDLEEGYYVLISFSAERTCVRELDRVMRIKESVLRHMIISKGE